MRTDHEAPPAADAATGHGLMTKLQAVTATPPTVITPSTTAAK